MICLDIGFSQLVFEVDEAYFVCHKCIDKTLKLAFDFEEFMTCLIFA
jgi:hypothetical protein